MDKLQFNLNVKSVFMFDNSNRFKVNDADNLSKNTGNGGPDTDPTILTLTLTGFSSSLKLSKQVDE
ncbi:hypothetical protein A9P82_13000 [Arachidicoccus ginsenosidimutans]|uniref:hypothetical protein n=1 Tax=Arachidicoccus sp. BS20 TaxID=1850526 RepID=UPI0007F080E6|nr:hypothetical protein [Arachidicoccus sp. BS20]ANI90113.1 hypothetical protein A9P82_12965 [Arachidicoccus sp. BS20]ANI90120.1 hypothetical protein A9P82_13000 [Arachidicoccus sp. BS20]